jgi:hypothetical protein
VVLACEGISAASKDNRLPRIIITVGCVVYFAVVSYECYLVIKFIHLAHMQDTSFVPSLFHAIRLVADV